MPKCDKCDLPVHDKDKRGFNGKTLCEDCYIDMLLPPVRKMYYENSDSFMLRLKDSYIACPQQYH